MNLTFSEKEYLSKMKSIDNFGRGELGKQLLIGLALGGSVATMIVAPGSAQGFKWVYDLHNKHKRNYKRNLERLEKKGYVVPDGNDNYYITTKGHLKLNEYKIKDLKIKKSKKWDKKWRILSFDIPEDKREARVALNKKLKELEFITLQKSVFIYPHNFKEEFQEIGKFFGVEKNIIFIEASEVSNEKELITIFKKKKIL